MSNTEFSEALRSFIRDTIPSLDAAELLVMLTREPARAYDPGGAVEALKPTPLSEENARRYLAHFEARGVAANAGEGRYRYAPADARIEELVKELVRAFNERPVTLVRVIYAAKDEKIRSFAEAFRIKK